MSKKIQIGKKVFKFTDSFGDFTLTTIKQYMSIHDDVEKLINDSQIALEKLEKIGDKIRELDEKTVKNSKSAIARLSKAKTKEQIERVENANEALEQSLNADYLEQENQILFLDAELSDLQNEITGKRIDLLCLLCESKSFREFITYTPGVTKDLINICVDACLKELGAFQDYWNSCPNVKSFSMKVDGKLFRKEKFTVHDMDKTTLIRETLASVQAQRAMNFKKKLDAGAWDHICKFVAILVRPDSQADEIAFTKKSFINGKQTRGMSHSEKTAFYLEKLESAWTQREKYFKDLKLSVAIGVLKEYFEKKK